MYWFLYWYSGKSNAVKPFKRKILNVQGLIELEKC